MKYAIHENELKTDDLLELFESVGWGRPDREMTETSIKNSYAVFSVTDGDRVIAMARIIGDGGMAFFLKDFVVAPDYQRQGIGRELIAYIEGYIQSQLKSGWDTCFQLMSAKGKEPFYLACGYTENPNENSGAGLTKIIVG